MNAIEAFRYLGLDSGAPPKIIRERSAEMKKTENDLVTLETATNLAAAFARNVVCPLCDGTGSIQGAFFYAIGKPVEHVCGTCNGTGKRHKE